MSSSVDQHLGITLCFHYPCQVHLFDINIPNRMSFKESEVLTPGGSLTTFDTDKCKFGLGICFDMRFEEMAKLYRLKGNLPMYSM